MKRSVVQLALREWDSLRRSRGLWVGMLAAGAVLGLVGPFGTEDALATLPRFAYWIAVTILTFSTGYCLSGSLIAFAEQRGWPAWLGFSIGALSSAAAIYAEILALNALAFQTGPGEMDVLVLGVDVLVIVIIITLAIRVISSPDAPREDHAPRLLDRLPPDVKAPLVSLSVTDHYVHVTTQRGTHMLLIRLSDAIAETAPTDGFQIHRSHWVAQDAIQSIVRSSRKSEVVLQSGERLPVSRTYLPQLKEAGFLPKSTA